MLLNSRNHQRENLNQNVLNTLLQTSKPLKLEPRIQEEVSLQNPLPMQSLQILLQSAIFQIHLQIRNPWEISFAESKSRFRFTLCS